MRNICLIPARSGSKGLKDKNMAFLNGKPVLQHTIDAAIDSGVFELRDIYVSTDSEEYIENLESHGISMLFRDPKLATDLSTTRDVVVDFLSKFDDEQVNLVLLQPTSPLRSGTHIREAFQRYAENNRNKVIVSVCESDKSPTLMSELGDNGELTDIMGIDVGYRRQNHKKLYIPNGAIYVTSLESYMEHNSFFTKDTIAYIMDKKSSIDIDDYDDFVNAIGAIFFDYKRREIDSKSMYESRFLENYNPNANKIIIGDSRTENMCIEGYLNLSMGGVTANTMLELVEKYVDNKNVTDIVINLGVNDIIVGQDLASINQSLHHLVNNFKNSNVYLCSIFPTIYRPNIDNEKIEQINEELYKISTVKIIDTYKKFELNSKLDFRFTNDGLHLNEDGEKCFKSLLESVVL